MNFKKVMATMLIATSVLTTIPTPTAFAAEATKVESTSLKDDIKTALKEKAAEDKAAADKKAADQKAKANSDKISKAAADIAVNIVNGKYNSAEDAVADISKSALKIINDTVIKEIPYVGPFANAIIGGIMGEDKADPVATKLGEIKDQLEVINTTIETCAKKIMDQQVDITKNEKVLKMNEAYNTVLDMFRDTIIDYSNGMKTIADDSDSTCRGDELKSAIEDLSNVYSARNTKALNKYTSFLNLIMSKGNIINPKKDYDPDIFTAFNFIAKSSGDGEFADMEFAEQKKMLIQNVEDIRTYGYGMFNDIMQISLANQETLQASYEAALGELSNQRVNVKGEDLVRLDKAISELKSKKRDCESCITAIKTDMSNLEQLMTKVDEYKAAEEARDAARNEEFKNYKPNENEYLGNTIYGVEKINGKDAFPKVNYAKNCVEYRDCYGNMVGRRTLENAKRINKDQIKVGEVYSFEAQNELTQSGVNLLFDRNEQYVRYSHYIEVTEVYQKNCRLSSAGTTTWVKGIDIFTKKEVSGCIDTIGHWNVYSSTPTNAIQLVTAK